MLQAFVEAYTVIKSLFND